MEAHQVKVTPIHSPGKTYRSKVPPHYLFFVNKVEGEWAHTWAYNAWGRVITDRIKLSDVVEYPQERN